MADQAPDGAGAPAPATGGEAAAGAAGEGDLTVFVTTLLGQMQTRFEAMSDQILGRIDEMGDRVGELEKNIDGLMAQAEALERASQEDASAAAARNSQAEEKEKTASTE